MATRAVRGGPGEGPQAGTAGRRSAKGEQRAQQLLDAGLVAMARRSAAETLPSRVEVLQATREDGCALGPASTGSFRHAFGSLAEYHRRLVAERLVHLNPSDPATSEMLRAGADAIAEGAVDLPELIGRIVRVNLETHLGQPDVAQARILTLAAGLAPGGDVVVDALREELWRLNVELADASQVMLDVWGMKVREPYTPASVAGLVTALATGVALRRLVDPASADLDDYEVIVVALLVLLVARPEDHRSLGRLIADVFPRAAPGTQE